MSHLTTRSLYLKVSYLGLCFSIVFTGYNVAQSFITTLFPGSFGFMVLFLVYISFGISSLFATSASEWLSHYLFKKDSEKFCMLMGSLTYFFFIFTLALKLKWLVILGSILIGIGGGFFWINQGAWVTRIIRAYVKEIPKSETLNLVGTATACFFGIYNFNGIIGNIIALALVGSGLEFQILIWSMMIVCFIGSVMIIFLSSIPKESNDELEKEQKEKTVALKEKKESAIQNAFTYMKLPTTLLLVPYALCQGSNISYNFANFPTFISYLTPEQQTFGIIMAFLFYGIGSLIGSFLWGRIYDYFHTKLFPLLLSHFVLITVTYSLLASLKFQEYSKETTIGFLYTIGFLFGIIDFLTNAVNNNSLTKYTPTKYISFGFSWYRFIYCIGFCLNATIGSLLPGVDQKGMGWFSILMMNYGMMLLSITSAFSLERIQQVKIEETISI